LPAAWEKPLRLLNELDPIIRKKALHDLGNLKASNALSDIIRLLTDLDDDVRLEAVIAIGKIGEANVGPELLPFIETKDIPFLMELIHTLGILGANGFSKAASIIEEFINHSNFRVRKFSIQALSQCGTSDSIEKVYTIFKEENTPIEIKEEIANTISQIGGSRAIEILSDLVREGQMEIRRAAIKGLGESKSPAALEILGKILQDKKEDKIIRNYTEDAVKKIIEGARTTYIRIKERAEEFLKGKN
jgi:HEAT repeat protein